MPALMFSNAVENQSTGTGALLICPNIEDAEGRFAYALRLANENMLGFSTVLQVSEPATASELAGNVHLLPVRAARICPSCLRGRGIGRVGCELRFADACPWHNCWLVDSCEKCGNRLTWARSSLCRCACGHLLAGERIVMAPPAVVRLSASLEAAALGRGRCEIPVLQGLSVEACFRLVQLLGAYATHADTTTPQKIAQADALSVSWNVSSVAAEILDTWPRGFFKLLDQLSKASGATGSLSRVFRGFYKALYGAFLEKEFHFLRKAFEEYLTEHWTGALGGRNRRLPDDVLAQAAWIPAKLAADEMGVSLRQLQLLFNEHELGLRERTTVSGRTFRVVRRSDVEQLKRTFAKKQPLEQVAIRLGLTTTRLAGLLPYLIDSRVTPARPGTPWIIPASWVQEWENFASGLRTVPRRNHTAVEDVLRFRAWSNKQVAGLLAAARSGHVAVMGRSPSPGLAGVLICSKSLKQWERALPQLHRADVSIPRAAVLLKVKQQVAYHLVRRELLHTQLIRGARRNERRVTSEALLSFSDNYVFGREIAKCLRRSPRRTARLLDELGIRPCAGPGVDQGRQLLYRRDDRLRGLMLSGTEESDGFVLRTSSANTRKSHDL